MKSNISKIIIITIIIINQDNDNNVTETKSFLKDELLSYGYMNILIVGEMDFSFVIDWENIEKNEKDKLQINMH